MIVGVDPGPVNCGKITDRARSYYDALIRSELAGLI
jgi:hypothetical protein